MSAMKAIRIGQVSTFYKACHEQYDAQRGDGMSQKDALAVLTATLANFKMNVKRAERVPAAPGAPQAPRCRVSP